MWITRTFAGGFLTCGSAIYAFKSLGGYSLRQVEGPSMRPTLNPEGLSTRDVVLVRNITDPRSFLESGGGGGVPVGTIVCVRHPKIPDQLLIKRLTAKAADNHQTGGGKRRWKGEVQGLIPVWSDPLRQRHWCCHKGCLSLIQGSEVGNHQQIGLLQLRFAIL